MNDSEHNIEHIDLALSGGGFRATLFHLGVIGFLRSQGLLGKVRNICSVSGGSILAAHMVTRWAEYKARDEDFEKAVKHLIDAIRKRDVTGHTLRRLRAVRRIILLKSLDPELLADEYRRILGPTTDNRERSWFETVRWIFGMPWRWAMHLLRRRVAQTEISEFDPPITRWEDLATRSADPDYPQLHCLATHLKTGSICVFNTGGFSISSSELNLNQTEKTKLKKFERHFDMMGQDIARAVAASSAFPPIFGPLPSSEEDEFKEDLLIDGGVCDNSGVRHLRTLYEKHEEWKTNGDRLVVVSDAGRAFSKLSKNYDTILNLATRVSDAQGNRIAEFDSDEARKFFEGHQIPVLRCSIHEFIEATSKSDNHTSIVQQRLRAIRTELDKFSEEEVFVLYRHGYRVAQKQYAEYCRQWKHEQWKPQAEKWLPGSTSLRKRLREPLEKSLRNSHEMKKVASLRKAAYLVALLAILGAVLVGGPFGITIDRLFLNPPINEVYKFELRLRGDNKGSPHQDYVSDHGKQWPYAFGSGLAYYQKIKGQYEFYMITDRGPAFDGPTSADGKLLKLYIEPKFVPQIAKVVWNGRGDSPPEVVDSYLLAKPGDDVNGLPDPNKSNGPEELTTYFDWNKNSYLKYQKNDQYAFGLDPEDLALSPEFEDDNTFWICEEYRPSIMKAILKNGIVEIQERVLTPGNGLPIEFGTGEPNRRIESIAINDEHLFVAMQSVCPNDKSPEPFIRIARAPLAEVRDYVDGKRSKEPEWKTFKYRIDKFYQNDLRQCSIGGLFAIDRNNLLVLEREGGTGPRRRFITKVNLETQDGFVTPTTWLNLSEIGWEFEKAEGITWIDDHTIAISADNDFGIQAEGEVVLATGNKKVPLYTSDMKLFQAYEFDNTYRIRSNDLPSTPNDKQEKDGNGGFVIHELFLQPRKGVLPWQTPFWVIRRAQAISSDK